MEEVPWKRTLIKVNLLYKGKLFKFNNQRHTSTIFQQYFREEVGIIQPPLRKVPHDDSRLSHLYTKYSRNEFSLGK